MHAVSFYSFKGGVGRTTLVVNAAYALAQRGAFVVVSDWDLHAPGLSTMEGMAMEGGPRVRAGLLEFLQGALAMEIDQKGDLIDPMRLAQPTRLGRRARERDPKFRGDVLFIPAGRFGAEDERDYEEGLRKASLKELKGWKICLESDEGAPKERRIAEYFRERVAQVRSPVLGADRPPDFLLLDSRPGLTEIGDLLLGELADHYVVVFGLNVQNQLGLKLILERVLRDKEVDWGGLPDLFTLVASPVPTGEEDLMRERYAALTSTLERLARPSPQGPGAERERMPRHFGIPYHPRIALTEEVMLEEYPDSGPSRAYLSIAEHLWDLTRSHSPERLQALIRARIQEAVKPEEEPEGPRRERRPAPPSPFGELPPWNWPAPERGVDDILPRGLSEPRQRVLDGLAWTSSLPKAQKLSFVRDYPKLKAYQIGDLFRLLDDERANIEWTWSASWRAHQRSLAGVVADWVDALSDLGLVDEGGVWRALAAETSRGMLPAALAGSPRFLLLLASELHGRRRHGAVPALVLRALRLGTWPERIGARVEEIRARLLRAVEGARGPAARAVTDGAATGTARSRPATSRQELWALIAATDVGEEAPRRLSSAGRAWAAAGWLDEALAALTHALELDAGYPATWFDLAFLQMELLRRTDLATATTEEALAKFPSEAPPWAIRGRIALRAGKYQDAEAAYRRAIEIADHPMAWLDLAAMLRRDLGRVDEAEQMLEQFVYYNPDDARGWTALGTLYAEDRQRYDDARTALGKAIGLDPESALLRLADAELALLARDADHAARRLDEAEEGIGPGDRAETICAALRVALTVRTGDAACVDAAVRRLADLRRADQPAAGSWTWEALLTSQDDLPAEAAALLRAATEAASGRSSAEDLEGAHEAWRASLPAAPPPH